MQQQSLIRRATTRQLHRAQESAPFRSAPEIFPTPPPRRVVQHRCPAGCEALRSCCGLGPADHINLRRCQYLPKEVLAVVIGVCSVVPYNMAGASARVFVPLGVSGCLRTTGLARRSWLTPLHLLLLVPWPSQPCQKASASLFVHSHIYKHLH